MYTFVCTILCLSHSPALPLSLCLHVSPYFLIQSVTLPPTPLLPSSLLPSLFPPSSPWDLYYKGSELYHTMQWEEMVHVFEESLLKLPDALQQCRDECYGPMKLGHAMGFAQVHSTVLHFVHVFFSLFVLNSHNSITVVYTNGYKSWYMYIHVSTQVLVKAGTCSKC